MVVFAFRLPSKYIEPKIGWWVGWVELDDNVWFFAMNMDMPTSDGLGLRQAITKEVLKQEKIILKWLARMKIAVI